MNDVPTVPIEVPLIGDERLKNWAKVVHNVDPNLNGGWSFDGDFVATGGIQDLPVAAVLLVYGERGSRGNPKPEARVYQVNSDATITLHATATGRAWARTLRDRVADMVAIDRPIVPGTRPWDPALMGYDVAALEEELRRRENLNGGASQA
ncbi:MAG TPA: hypothetical protein VFY15_07450 [Acidimicrobiia bacterium]|nr:hypothetical protein [Acidimicrobiia bacterium]